MTNAVIYARYSSHNQTEQSIEGQLRICNEYAKREGYTVVGEYIDRALTGRNDDRPDFHRMIEDSSKKQFQYVIVYKLDRFARNRYDSAVYKRKLKLNGVRVLSAEETIGDNPESIILEAVLEASAEYYSVDLSQKITRGMTDSAMKGRFLGGSVPLGYKNVDKHLVIDPDTAPVVKWAFEQYASGMPVKAIVDDLNARGLRNRQGKPFCISSFAEVFPNRKYIGEMKWKDVIIPDALPAIVDIETFEKVQERVQRNKHKGGRRGAEKVEYLLTGKIYCGLCGARVSADCGHSAQSGVYHYYACINRKKGKSCEKKNEKKDFLEWFICEQTVEYVLRPQRQKAIASAVVEQYHKDFDIAKISDIERQIRRLQHDIERYTDQALEMPRAARQHVYDKIERADALKADLEIDLAKLRIASGIQMSEEDIIAWLRSFCKGDLFDMDFRQRIIDVFVHSVYLYDDKIVIWYNIKGGKQVSHIELMDAIDTQKEKSEPLVKGSDSKGYGGA